MWVSLSKIHENPAKNNHPNGYLSHKNQSIGTGIEKNRAVNIKKCMHANNTYIYIHPLVMTNIAMV